MAAAVILESKQDLEDWAQMNKVKHWVEVKEITAELRMMADFLRDEKSGERSRLNYYIGDVVYMVNDITEIAGHVLNIDDKTILSNHRDWVRETRMRMINLAVDGEDQPHVIIRTENAGEEFRGDEDVVGLEEDVQLLLRRGIFGKEKTRLTFLVKGMAGIGKTALARQVYNHPAVIRRFDCRAWISLSSGLTNTEVLVKIMQQVVGSKELRGESFRTKVDRADIPSLQRMLHRHLKGRSYLIVVDNMLKGMLCLKCVVRSLPKDNRSRLLLTSRSLGYVNQVTVNYVHEMKTLDPDNSWRLFVKTINKFTSDEEEYIFPKHLEKKWKDIMTKACGGLPVAIIDVGKQKAKQKLEQGIKWEELLEFDSIDLSAILEFLESSYRELDEQLQARFMYVAFFKENTKIRAKKLEQIWVAAGGFDKTGNDFSYIYALARESFVEVEDKAGFKVKYCCVNTLLHRLSVKVAEKEIGFEILRNFDGNNYGANSRTSPRRHCVIHWGRDNKFNHCFSAVDKDKHLVSLIFRGGGACLDDAYWKRFEQLKLLDLEGFGLKILSETIGTSLTELKYLGLRNNYIQEIPRSLGCLKKLEILDISQNFMVEVPDIIWEMSGLQNLYMSNVICSKPLKIDVLENLETLAYISVYDFLGLETTTMMNLERLGTEEVDEYSDVSKLFESLAQLENFSRLTLRGFRFKSMPRLDEVGALRNLRTLKLDGLLARLPTADDFPPYIKELSLVNSRLDEDPMPVLENLDCLINLRLQNAYTGRQMVIHQEGFFSLKVLCIKELWNLRNLEVAQAALGFDLVWDEDRGVKVAGMEKLERLEIDNCPCLEKLPEEIRSMKHLKKLKMVTTKDIATKIRKSGVIPRRIEVDITP